MALIARSSVASPRYVHVMLSRSISAVSQALSMVVVARFAGPDQFGVFAAYFAGISVIMILADLGVQTLGIRHRAKEDSAALAVAVMGLQRLMNLGVGFLLQVVMILLVVTHQVPPWSLFIAPALFFDKELMGGLGLALSEGRSRIQLFALGVSRATCLGITVLGISLLHLPAIYVYLSCFMALSAVACAYVSAAGPRYNLPKWTEAFRMVRQAFPFWVATLSGQIRSLDLVLVSLFSTSMQTGLYALPSRATGPARILGTSLSAMAIPAAARGDRDELRRLSRTMHQVGVTSVIGFAVVAITAESVVPLIMGDAYQGSVRPLQIICVGLAMNVPGSYLSGLLQGSGQQARIARLGVGLGIITLILVPLGALTCGASGAATAVTIIYVIQFSAVSYLWRRWGLPTFKAPGALENSP